MKIKMGMKEELENKKVHVISVRISQNELVNLTLGKKIVVSLFGDEFEFKRVKKDKNYELCNIGEK